MQNSTIILCLIFKNERAYEISFYLTTMTTTTTVLTMQRKYLMISRMESIAGCYLCYTF